MGRYLSSRLLHSVLVVLGVVILTFFLVRLTGDPTVLVLPQEATPEARERFRKQMGLDKPIWEQFAAYVEGVARGDFGTSLTHRRPATELVLQRLPATFELVGAALVIALVSGVPLGLISAVKFRSGWDRLGRLVSLVAVAAPGYWIGLMAIMLFAVEWRFFPTSGRSGLRSLILPACTLAMPLMGRLVRLTRSSVLELLNEDYIRTAFAKGLARWTVYHRHLLRNAAIPIVTLLGVYASYMVAGSVLVESVFAWPGVGLLATQAILKRDFPLVQAIAVYVSIAVVVISLCVDFLYGLLDPRINILTSDSTAS